VYRFGARNIPRDKAIRKVENLSKITGHLAIFNRQAGSSFAIKEAHPVSNQLKWQQRILFTDF
jgi:hypothetical protein